MKVSVICRMLVFSLAVFSVIAGPATGAEHIIRYEDSDSCLLCGMYIREFFRTAVEVVYQDGTRRLYCGVACALRDIDERGGLPLVREAHITDWESGEEIPLDRATYLIGSKVIPDMIPSIIPFQDRAAASAFQSRHGGAIIPLDTALVVLSPQGLTVPFRIAPAAVPPRGVFSVAGLFGTISRGKLMRGDHKISSADALADRSKCPDQAQGYAVSTKLGYSITDDINLSLQVPYYIRRLTVRKKDGDKVYNRREGLGDSTLTMRWRFYRDIYFDQHLALLVGTSLPTGEYKNKYREIPGFQLGRDAAGLTGGLLFSRHLGKFWLHAAATYRYDFENSADYQFGDELSGGVALHYTYDPDLMLGVEFDGTLTGKNKDDGDRVAGTGGLGIFGTVVGQYRFANFWGGILPCGRVSASPYIKISTICNWERITIWAGDWSGSGDTEQ